VGNCPKHCMCVRLCKHTATTQEIPHLRAAPYKESVFSAADSNAVLHSWTQLPPFGQLISSYRDMYADHLIFPVFHFSLQTNVH
jgi:hypothetical protein